MKHNISLKKNVIIKVELFTDLFNKTTVWIREINGYKPSLRFTKTYQSAFEDALGSNLKEKESLEFKVSICVKKDMLYINDKPIVEINMTGLCEISFALSKIVGYSIDVEKQHLVLAGRDVQNWSKQVESIIELGESYQKSLDALKEKYSKKIEKNHIFAFRIIQYRGNKKDFYENDNRLAGWDSVGYYQDNFDEKIWNELQRYES